MSYPAEIAGGRILGRVFVQQTYYSQQSVPNQMAGVKVDVYVLQRAGMR